MSTIKYAIFDVGQTIYPFTLRPLNQLMEKLTLDKKAYAEEHSVKFYDYTAYMKGQLSDREFAKDLCTFCHVPYTNSTLPQINKALHQGCGTPFTETIEAMHKLKTNGIEIGILSNALPLLADTKIDFISPNFTFTSFDLGLLKPDLAIYQELANQLCCNYDEILFIDDKKQNIEAAQSLGIQGIIFKQETILNAINQYIPATLTLREKFQRS